MDLIWWSLTPLIIVVIPALILIRLLRAYPDPRWDWEWINTSEVNFPDSFLWGVATSAHQVESGCDNNNWSRWELETRGKGPARIKTGERVGRACEHDTRYPEDLPLIKALGCNAYRFSVEWSKIEPRPGEFDQKALDHYRKMVLAIRAAGLEPMVTLHHFTNPGWFEARGAFEHSENIQYLVRFSEKVFDALQDQVTLWCTINEPAVYASLGYYLGAFPPGKHSLKTTGSVLKNMLAAHVAIYQALKKRPGGNTARIGLVKNLNQFDPYRRWHLLDWYIARTLHRLFNSCIYYFLKTGRFRFRLFGITRINYTNRQARFSNDFIGLNYYSHSLVKFGLGNGFFTFKHHKSDLMTDIGYDVYPEGLYRALMETKQLKLPIFITENGIADARDAHRFMFIRTYLYALSQAIQDGAKVEGYFYWSLMDNFEWAEGYSMKFGLYEVDFETQARKLRKGAEAYRMVIEDFAHG